MRIVKQYIYTYLKLECKWRFSYVKANTDVKYNQILTMDNFRVITTKISININTNIFNIKVK